MAQRKPQASSPSLEVIVGNEKAPEGRSDALLHDADKKPNLNGHNSPRRGVGRLIAQSVRDELENWSEGQRIRTAADLAKEFPGGGPSSIKGLLAYHFRDEPHLLELRQEILAQQGVQHLLDRPMAEWSEHSRQGYQTSLALLSKKERSSIGYRALDAQNNRKHVGGVRFDSAEEFALGQILKLYVPKFRIAPGDTYQVPIGEKSIDYLVPAKELAVFVEWHPIKTGEPGRHMSDFPSHAMYKQFQRALRRTTEGREAIRALWRKKLLDIYAAERRALVDASAYDGTPLVVGAKPLQLLPLFSHLDIDTPNSRSFTRAFKELAHEYRTLGIRELNRRYSL